MDAKRASAVFLMETLPSDSASAWQAATQLAETLAYLPWPDRANTLDRFSWDRARTQLGNDHVTAVINRQADQSAEGGPVADYARYCGAVVGATLIALQERRPVEDVHHALVRMVSLRPEDRDLARDWLDGQPARVLDETLVGLPGLAFLLLTGSSADSALSFTARDAFWAAMLGQA
jgi:hypothetical protein